MAEHVRDVEVIPSEFVVGEGSCQEDFDHRRESEECARFVAGQDAGRVPVAEFEPRRRSGQPPKFVEVGIRHNGVFD